MAADVTSSPRPIRLGGKEYLMSPLSDRDIEELDQWLKSKVIQMAIDAIPQNASDQICRSVLDSANRVAMEISWMSPEGARQMRTLDGMARLFWQSIKINHPEMSHIDVRKCLVDARVVDEALSAFDDLNNLRADSSKKKIRTKRRKQPPKKERK
jgi:hypothetical protein